MRAPVYHTREYLLKSTAVIQYNYTRCKFATWIERLGALARVRARSTLSVAAALAVAAETSWSSHGSHLSACS